MTTAPLPLTEEEIRRIKEVSQLGWDELCSEIRNSNGRRGEYPSDWWEKIVMGNLVPGGSDIDITSVPNEQL